MTEIAEPPIAVVEAPPHRGTFDRVRARGRDFALVPAIIVLLVVGSFVDPVFLTRRNLTEVLQQQTEISLLVLGEALILFLGRIDLSLESMVGFAPALAVMIVTDYYTGLPGWTAIPICLLLGLAGGLLNGLLIVKFKLSAFIVTLGMLIVLRGLQVGFTGGKSLFLLPSKFPWLGRTRWSSVPVSVVLCGVLYIGAIFAMGYLRQGRSIYAIGGNAAAARAAGIRTDRIVISVFMLAGLLAALAGMLTAGRLGSVAANQGQGWIFTVMAASVIGGVSLNGGRGTIFGALSGVLVLGLIENILVLAGVSAQWDQAIYGVIILVALVLSRLTSGEEQTS
jgi:simple sugar transport system permease protein/ribose transport system permease protein